MKQANKSLSFAVPILLLLAFVACQDSNTLQQPAATPEHTASDSNAAQPAPASPPANFKHQTAAVNGINIHYVIGGTGDPLVLVHGFGQNWYMWNRLLPELSKHFTVIAPDLRGVGESDKPGSGYDKKTMASDIHELVKKLGYNNINLVGHDIGLMVAYAYAASFPTEVKKVALLDALLPGIEPIWGQYSTQAWWFGFFARPIAGKLVDDQAGLFLTDFWPIVGFVKDPFTKEETAEFIRAYSTPGATTGSFAWFGAFPQDAKDNLEFMKHKLTMPLLAMGSDHLAGSFLANHSKVVATDVHETIITGSGHWIVQEQTEQVQKGLLDFFTGK
jgi:pimeloyl-ACP methyl ester carboxylesterase